MPSAVGSRTPSRAAARGRLQNLPTRVSHARSARNMNSLLQRGRDERDRHGSCWGRVVKENGTGGRSTRLGVLVMPSEVDRLLFWKSRVECLEADLQATHPAMHGLIRAKL